MPFVTFFDLGAYFLLRELFLNREGLDLYAGEEEQEGPAVNAADLAPVENTTGRKIAGAKRVAKAHEQKVKNEEQQEKNADNETKGEASTARHDEEPGDASTAERRDDAMSIGA